MLNLYQKGYHVLLGGPLCEGREVEKHLTGQETESLRIVPCVVRLRRLTGKFAPDVAHLWYLKQRTLVGGVGGGSRPGRDQRFRRLAAE